MQKAVGLIPQAEEDYIFLLLGHTESEGKERGLERLCGHYQRGLRLRKPHPFYLAFIGCLYHATPSVRRWALNAIAVAGKKHEHLQSVLDAIDRDRGDEDIFAAGIGALVALTTSDERAPLLQRANVALEGTALLAAAQQADSFKSELAKQRVNIETASPPELRLAAVLLGLGKAPEHLFDLGHENSAVIGRLDAHPDALVAQYAVWSICEHPALGLSHMSSSVRDIESRPERVRGYTYRLITQDDVVAEAHREFIQLGSVDPSGRARTGLACGLAKAFFDGLEGMTLDWHDAEQDQPIKEELLDHVVRFSERSAIYEDKAYMEYEAAALGSLRRARMRAAAQGLPIYARFKKLDIAGETGSLFGNLPLFGETRMTTINATTVNAGLIGDHARVGGDLKVINQSAERATEELKAIKTILDEAGSDALIKEGKDLVAEATAKPTKGTITKVLKWMKGLAEGTGYLAATVEGFRKGYEALEGLLDGLPDF